jgi:hypothetical protein
MFSPSVLLGGIANLGVFASADAASSRITFRRAITRKKALGSGEHPLSRG